MHLTFTADAARVTASDTDRTLAGLAAPYGVPGRTSAGPLRIAPGALTLPDPLSRVKLTRDHDSTHPVVVGAALTASDDDDGLRLTFAMGTTPAADLSMAEATHVPPLRDGLSVELDDVVVDGDLIVSASLRAVAHVPFPAFTGARLAAADNTDPDTGTADHTPEDPPMTDTADPAAAAAAAVDAAPPAVSAAVPATVPGHTPARTRPRSAALAMAQAVVAARMDGTSPSVVAALSDVTPAGNGAGNDLAGLALQALGELWNGVEYVAKYRPLIAGGQLTGASVTGWRWSVPPEVDDYSGNKAEIPSNDATLEAYDVKPTRVAGGHDLDRVYQDLGDPAMLLSYWRKMAESISKKYDRRALDLIRAAAGAAITPAPASLMEARVRGAFAVEDTARATFTIAANNLLVADALTKQIDAPVGPSFPLPTVTPSGELPAGTVLTGASPAVRLLTLDPPIRVQAVNVARGGIDAALFGYSASVVEDASGVVAQVVAGP